MIETKISSQKVLIGTRRKDNIPHDEKGFVVFLRLTVTPLEITHLIFFLDQTAQAILLQEKCSLLWNLTFHFHDCTYVTKRNLIVPSNKLN